MMIILHSSRGAVDLHLLSGSTENSFAFFRRGWRDEPAHPTSISGLKPAPKPSRRMQREKKMKQLLKLSATPITALGGRGLGIAIVDRARRVAE
jgi:hypothetical protein